LVCQTGPERITLLDVGGEKASVAGELTWPPLHEEAFDEDFMCLSSNPLSPNLVVASGRTGEIKVWDVTTRACAATITDFEGAASDACWTGLNSIVAICHGNQSICRWDLVSGGGAVKLTDLDRTELNGDFWDLASSPQSNLLAAITAKGDIVVWDARSRLRA
jgi:WD40 repeat protein